MSILFIIVLKLYPLVLTTSYFPSVSSYFPSTSRYITETYSPASWYFPPKNTILGSTELNYPAASFTTIDIKIINELYVSSGKNFYIFNCDFLTRKSFYTYINNKSSEILKTNFIFESTGPSKFH